MKQKQLLILVGVLVGLLLVAFLTGTFDDEISTVEVPVIRVPADKPDKIEVAAADLDLSIQRVVGNWQMLTPRISLADSVQVQQLVQSVRDLLLESVVTSNPERYARYGVAEENATSLTLSWPEETLTLAVGNQGPDYRSVYVRLGDDPRVFLTAGPVNLPRQLDRWRDQGMLQVPVEDIASAAVTTPEQTFTVRNTGMGWQVEAEGDSAPADSAEVARWLQQFRSMRANGFADDIAVEAVQAEPTHRLELTASEGPLATLWLQARGDTLAAAITGPNDATFNLLSSRLTTIFPAPETLREE